LALPICSISVVDVAAAFFNLGEGLFNYYILIGLDPVAFGVNLYDSPLYEDGDLRMDGIFGELFALSILSTLIVTFLEL
jgi:hypothetical protein